MSVLNGNSCAVCWRLVMGGVHYRQTLDEVTRALCSGCYTLLYPQLPPGMEGSQIVRVDAKQLLRRKGR